MRSAAFFLLAAAPLLGGDFLLRQSAFTEGDPAWTVWSHRSETRPRAFIDAVWSRGEAGSLALSGASNPAAYGGWQRTLTGLRPGEWLRFRGYYRAEGVAAENWQVVARLDWRNAAGQRVDQPDYLSWARREGDWTEVSGEAQAPAGATAVTLELLLGNAPQGTLWWDDLAVERIPAPAPRRVKVASVNLRPSKMAGPEQSVQAFLDAIGRTVPADADVILLPEGITVVGTPKAYTEVAEPIPGPTTRALGAVARERKAYLVAGIYEREGAAVYNTAVLIDRAGQVIGRYRKVYLPREEVERGLTPGAGFPVFRTDFGTVGLMICYDVFFPDPARALAAQGAELLLMPIWGGDEHLAKARAIENGVYLAASGYDHPTYVMDPLGERLSEARERGTAAVATLDLARHIRLPWLGEMRTRRLREARIDVPLPLPGLRQ